MPDSAHTPKFGLTLSRKSSVSYDIAKSSFKFPILVLRKVYVSKTILSDRQTSIRSSGLIPPKYLVRPLSGAQILPILARGGHSPESARRVRTTCLQIARSRGRPLAGSTLFDAAPHPKSGFCIGRAFQSLRMCLQSLESISL